MARRSKFQREKDLEELARRYLRGEAQMSIAEDMNVSQATISNDLKELQKRWLASSLINIDEAKAKELAKIDALELEYWEAWERSLEDAETEIVEKAATGDQKRGKVVNKRVGQSGNPSFLAGVQWCINKRCEILGLDAPKRTDVTSGGKELRLLEVVPVDYRTAITDLAPRPMGDSETPGEDQSSLDGQEMG